jgi:hypothetical protein
MPALLSTVPYHQRKYRMRVVIGFKGNKKRKRNFIGKCYVRVPDGTDGS